MKYKHIYMREPNASSHRFTRLEVIDGLHNPIYGIQIGPWLRRHQQLPTYEIGEIFYKRHEEYGKLAARPAPVGWTVV